MNFNFTHIKWIINHHIINHLINHLIDHHFTDEDESRRIGVGRSGPLSQIAQRVVFDLRTPAHREAAVEQGVIDIGVVVLVHVVVHFERRYGGIVFGQQLLLVETGNFHWNLINGFFHSKNGLTDLKPSNCWRILESPKKTKVDRKSDRFGARDDIRSRHSTPSAAR